VITKPAAQNYLITVKWLFSPDLSTTNPDFMFGSCGCSRRVAVTVWVCGKAQRNAAIELRDEYCSTWPDC